MRLASSLLLLSVLGSVTNAYDNTPPIPDRLPGQGLEQGSNKYNIDIELIYDLGCDKCKAEHPMFQQFLQAPFLDGKVIDAVNVRYAFHPLPFHFGAWIMTKLIPYMEDVCYDQAPKTNQCTTFLDYITLAFNQQDWLITSTSTSYNALVLKWTQTIADNMKLDVNELRKVYDPATDTHNSEKRTRMIWKYTAARAVGGTPNAFVNGVRLQKTPTSVDQWTQLITDVYNSQYKVQSGHLDMETAVKQAEKKAFLA